VLRSVDLNVVEQKMDTSKLAKLNNALTAYHRH